MINSWKQSNGMSDKVKKTVNKPSKDDKLKGQGNSPNQCAPRNITKPPSKKSSSARQEVGESATAASRQAGLAALARVIANKNNDSPSSSLATQHLLVESNRPKKHLSLTKQKSTEECLAVEGVYFTCPLLGTEILTKEEWKQKLTGFLDELLKVEKSLASCLMIHSLNRSADSVTCVETLCKILQNIILNPQEEKYKKIRTSNKVFKEKVSKIIGALEFLESIGFVKQNMNSHEKENENGEEEYYIFPSEIPDCQHLEQMIDLLCNTEPITLELHRNIKVLTPSQVLEKVELPDEFFIKTPNEIKREQLRKTESLENSKILKTKSMREKEKSSKINNYAYTLIRIRFPDGLYLQGTFGVYERLSVVKDFVRVCIDDSIVLFKLATAFGKQLAEADNEKTLDELNLVPAVLLIFTPVTPFTAARSILEPTLLSNVKN